MTSSKVFSFFWSCIKPYKGHYLLMLQAPLLGSLYWVVNNYAIKWFIDVLTVTQHVTYTALIGPILLFIGCKLGAGLLYRIADIAEWKSEPFVRKAILTKTYNYVQHHSYAFFQNHFSGSLTSKIKGILEGYNYLASRLLYDYAQYISSIITGTVALGLINMQLTGVTILWMAIVVPVMWSMSQKTSALASDQTESKHKAMGLIADNLGNITALFSFASRKKEHKTLETLLQNEFIPKQVRMYTYNFRIQLVGMGLHVLLLITVVLLMVHYRQQDLVSIGDFAFVFGLWITLGGHVFAFSTGLKDLFERIGDVKSAFNTLAAPHETPDVPQAQDLQVQNATVVFKNLSFRYPKSKAVFTNFNLHIRPGEKVGLVGHSGAGKSTLVNLVLRYFQRIEGTIAIDGQDIAQVTQDSLRRHIAVIPQEPTLFHRSLLENIRYGNLEASDEAVIEVSQKAHIHDFIRALPEGYHTEVGERGVKLSGGQRQRIAIARAMLKDAPILILDEATSSLDSQTEQQVQESLQHLIANRNTTVIAIAHRLSTLRQMDRILVMHQGQIVQEGTHEQLLKDQGLYRELWDAQMMV